MNHFYDSHVVLVNNVVLPIGAPDQKMLTWVVSEGSGNLTCLVVWVGGLVGQ